MWALDRDLLAIEPNLFRDVGFAGQQMVRGVGRFADGQIVLDTGNFDSVRFFPGLVVTVGRSSVEFVGEPSGTSATVSHIRATREGDVIMPANSDLAEVVVTSFRPQLEIVHRQLLSMLGLVPADGSVPGTITELMVLNSRELVLLECLGTLHLIYAAASAPGGNASWMNERAEMYKKRFAQERWRAVARLDTDNDGVIDTIRRFNVVKLERV